MTANPQSSSPLDAEIDTILEDMAESYYPEHEYNDIWRDRNKELRDEAKAALQSLITRARIEEQVLFQDWLHNPEGFELDSIDRWSANRLKTLTAQLGETV